MRKPIEGPFVWTGPELTAATDWRFELGPRHRAEIDAALAQVKSRGVAWREMRRADFPLAETAGLLGQLSAMLEDGRGLAKLSGLSVEGHAEEDLRRI